MVDSAHLRKLDTTVYLLFAALLTLGVARQFYGYMLVQTGGQWSAPLDDVFIHFDYARAAARGFLFQWSEGNGYSSGNTSLLYPLVLALGYRAGFQGSELMVWAALVAAVSVFGVLAAAPRLFTGLHPLAKYLAPPALFCIGALDWSLWSGMEVSLYLGLWGMALVALSALTRDFTRKADSSSPSPWVLGWCGALLVVTRPEGATAVLVMGLVAAWYRGSGPAWRGRFAIALKIGAPSLALLLAQAIANKMYTGEFAANGAIVKLSLYNPYMTAGEKWDEYLFLLSYVVRRNVEYHFSARPLVGWLLPLMALVPLCHSVTRPKAVLLWATAAGWLLLVSLNAQVRWQNERYTMPAVACLAFSAALGAGLLLFGTENAPLFERARSWLTARTLSKITATLAASAAIAVFAWFQRDKMRDQIWFFGRASRNILEQHVRAGELLRQMKPLPRRVLVGDAGALMYASDLPGLDLIGLGGYHDLPFARASVHGLGATLELLERMPASDWPDTMAIYPSWWGALPVWFGVPIAEVPVRGNVICGGAEKVLYTADFHRLGHGGTPLTLERGEKVVDELDVADLVSEKEHRYRFPSPGAGFVEAKILGDVEGKRDDFFDGGRRIPQGRSESFVLRYSKQVPARLVVRSAPEKEGELILEAEGSRVSTLLLTATRGWREQSIPLPSSGGDETALQVTLKRGGDWMSSHYWVVQARE